MTDQISATGVRVGTVRCPYGVGIVTLGAFRDVLAYGRSLGLDVQDLRGGGVLVRRGYVVARGRESELFKFFRALRRLETLTS